MKADYADKNILNTLINSMRFENGVALTVALETGLRIGDVLKIEKKDIKGNEIHYKAEKTGKKGVASVSEATLRKMRACASGKYIFPGTRSNPHRTRQAVYLDLKRVCRMYGIKTQISPHSTRKSFAVDEYHEHGFEAVKQKLQHSSDAVTLLYALSDSAFVPNNSEHLFALANECYKLLVAICHKLDIDIDTARSAVYDINKQQEQTERQARERESEQTEADAPPRP